MIEKMKKLSFILGAAIATLSLTISCNKIEENPSIEANGSAFVLGADIVNTKTTLDASTYAVDWANGDIIYAVTTDEEWGYHYVKDDDKGLETIAEFTYNNGSFTTESTISAAEHTFNFIYSNGDQKSYHRGDVTTNKLDSRQTQDCAKPTEHIKASDAMIGQATATTPTDFVHVEMSHLYALMEVDVKNNTGADIQITALKMSADTPLAGTYAVDFENKTMVMKTGVTGYQDIDLAVQNGTVANGASLPLYFVIAPLESYSGKITLKVTASNGRTYTKTITANDLTFAAGTYNTTPYTLTEADPMEQCITFTAASDIAATGAKTLTKDGVTLTIGDGLLDNGSEYRIYKNKDLTISSTIGNIEKVVFTCTANGTTKYGPGCFTTSDGTYTYEGKVGTLVVSGSKASVKLTASSNQVRATEIKVYYE